MRQIMWILLAFLLLGGEPRAEADKGYARPDMIVETGWLAARLDDSRVRIVDLRSTEDYGQGHIPGAVHFDPGKLRTKDADASYLPPPGEFATLMGNLGVRNKSRVVIYDDRSGAYGARLWYVLDYYGHRNVSLLDGGWIKWIREDRPVSVQAPEIRPGTYKVKANPQVVCTLDQMKSSVDSGKVVLVDSRSPEEYDGSEVRAKRGGHIPGAVNIEWRRNLTEEGTFKPASELRSMYEQAGITANKQVIAYCQSGGRASHTLFVLRLIGIDQARNYYGSWDEWGNLDDTPVVKPERQDAKPDPQH